MQITIDAVYEAGVFKPLIALPQLKEHEKVRLIVEPLSIVADQRQKRIQLDPALARHIIDSPEFDLFDG
jgi:predicted DNA-binding antitoxin AbrB/MazE fold protein